MANPVQKRSFIRYYPTSDYIRNVTLVFCIQNNFSDTHFQLECMLVLKVCVSVAEFHTYPQQNDNAIKHVSLFVLKSAYHLFSWEIVSKIEPCSLRSKDLASLKRPKALAKIFY